MKRFFLTVLACLMAASLCACASRPGPQGTTSPSGTLPSPTNPSDPSGSSDPVQSGPTQDPVELAKSCIDKPVAELYALLGEPNFSDYAPSCLVDGEDGELHYDGFIVYTLKTDEGETVYSVSEE